MTGFSAEYFVQSTKPIWRRWRWILAAAVIVLLAVSAVLYVRGQTEIAQQFAAIRARGEPTSMDELEAYYTPPSADQDVTQLWLSGAKLLAAQTAFPAVKQLPFIGEANNPPLLGQPWPKIGRSRQFLQKNAVELQQLHAAAERGGRARYLIGIANMNNSQLIRNAARCLQLEAYVRAHDNDLHGAAESIRTGLLLSQSLENGPSAIDQLVRIALHGVAIDTLKRIGPDNLPAADLQRLQTTLSQIEFSAAVKRVAVGERAYGLTAFDDPNASGALSTPVQYVYPLWQSADLMMFLRVTSELVAVSERAWPARADAMDEWAEQTRFRATRLHGLTQMLIPMFPTMHNILARAETANRLALISVAIGRYRQQHGRPPESLGALVPELFTELPLDPVADAPFQFRATEDGYLLYSPANSQVSVSIQKPDAETGADPRLVLRWPPPPEEPDPADNADESTDEPTATVREE